MDLQRLKEEAAADAGFDLSQKEQGNCVSCRQPAMPRIHSSAGLREFQISGLCEECFDQIYSDNFADEEIEEETEDGLA